ncbi:MAG: glycosyltransferase family 4 protein [Terracoccus sp.]
MTDGVSPRVLVVGSGWRFTSGISYYTCRLANALAGSMRTDVLLMRRLVPTALYPGRSRVNQPLNELAYDDSIDIFDGVDWYWGRSMLEARAFLDEHQPDIVVLQWWTGAVLHSYLALATMARRRGAKVIIEWHEVQDTGEARIPGVTRYVGALMHVLLRRADAHVVHSHHDLELLRAAYGLSEATAPGGVTVVPHGPYDHVVQPTVSAASSGGPGTGDRPFTVLFFGTIRPYKGLEHLVAAFEALPAPLRDDMELRIVGETWEGWTAPVEAALAGPARDRITVVNRYVTDAEARTHFAEADAVVLPYLRSSASGPLHMAMSAGLPTVVTSVGGLVEAAADYEGVTFVPPDDVGALTAALEQLPPQRGRRFADPHSWDTTVATYQQIIARLGTVERRRSPWPRVLGEAGRRDERVAL